MASRVTQMLVHWGQTKTGQGLSLMGKDVLLAGTVHLSVFCPFSPPRVSFLSSIVECMCLVQEIEDGAKQRSGFGVSGFRLALYSQAVC